MRRRTLTVQDAFLGARPEQPPAEPERARATTHKTDTAAAPSKPRAPRSPAKAAAPRPSLDDVVAEVEASRRQVGPRERLTLYLPPDLSADLTRLWEELRERTGLKVGKSLLGTAALRVVLRDDDLAVQTATEAVRAKLGK